MSRLLVSILVLVSFSSSALSDIGLFKFKDKASSAYITMFQLQGEEYPYNASDDAIKTVEQYTAKQVMSGSDCSSISSHYDEQFSKKLQNLKPETPMFRIISNLKDTVPAYVLHYCNHLSGIDD